MATSKKELVKKLLKNNNIEGNEEELLEMLIDQSIAIDPDKEKLSKGDKLADKFTEIAGSWTFIIIFTICLVLWIFLNLTKIIELDEYPFILLNLVLSCLAAFQAPIIMMSQNRAAEKDSLRGKNDYKTDLKSELILEELHEQMTKMISNQNKIIKLLSDEDKK